MSTVDYMDSKLYSTKENICNLFKISWVKFDKIFNKYLKIEEKKWKDSRYKDFKITL